jgi:hypothetical protein
MVHIRKSREFGCCHSSPSALGFFPSRSAAMMCLVVRSDMGVGNMSAGVDGSMVDEGLNELALSSRENNFDVITSVQPSASKCSSLELPILVRTCRQSCLTACGGSKHSCIHSLQVPRCVSRLSSIVADGKGVS